MTLGTHVLRHWEGGSRIAIRGYAWQSYYKTLSKKPSSATPPTTGVGEDAGKKEPSYTVGGNVD
jgi:hypothetical protein